MYPLIISFPPTPLLPPPPISTPPENPSYHFPNPVSAHATAAPRFPSSTSGGSGLHRSLNSDPKKYSLLKAARDGDLRLFKESARALDEGEGRVAEKLGAVRDSKGVGVLHFAAISGSLAMCRYLVEDLGFDVDALSHKHETPLTFAITRGNLDLVRYFLGQGADIERPNIKGWTPLYLAATDAKPEIVELLLSKGAKVDSLSGGATALHVAASGVRDDVVKILLDHHADPNIAMSMDGRSSTSLAAATSSGSLKCVKLLLEAGADVNGIGERPLVLAAGAGLTDILKCLVLAGADANVCDKYGLAPIELAAVCGRREDVEILFPVTSCSPNVCHWSVDGIISYGKLVKQAEFEALEAMKHGNWLTAAQSFTKAIDLYHNVYLLANRSLCWLILGDAEKALMDAQVCRMMRPGWAEAYNRQGHALMLLKDYEKACDAYLDGLKLEPGNARFEKDLRGALESLKTSGST